MAIHLLGSSAAKLKMKTTISRGCLTAGSSGWAQRDAGSQEIVTDAGVGHTEVRAKLLEGRAGFVALDDFSQLFIRENLLWPQLAAGADEVSVHGAFVDTVPASKLSQAGAGLIAGDQLRDIRRVEAMLRPI